MNKIVVREVRSDDFSQWLQLWTGYNAFYGRSGTTALPHEITNTTWQRIFDPAEPVHALVAETNGKIVGLAHYLFHRSTIQIQPTCYLQDLFTEPQARGLGIGQKLIFSVYDLAKSAGSPRVYWQTHETNATAMRLYDKIAERSGFIVYRKILDSSET
ncbi:GNAT family N-acetyltransferase [Solilutibacter silvestris]|nr:GNAT family N-acetyltransferase [Lysobacter silvestris]